MAARTRILREALKSVFNIEIWIRHLNKSEKRTSRCLCIGEALSNVRRQTGCASPDLRINIIFWRELYPSSRAVTGINRFWLIWARLSANCKRCFIRKCWAGLFRCSRLRKTLTLRWGPSRLSNLRASRVLRNKNDNGRARMCWPSLVLFGFDPLRYDVAQAQNYSVYVTVARASVVDPGSRRKG